MVASGCGRAPETGPGAPGELSVFDQRAEQVAGIWQAADIGEAWNKGFVPVQELTIAPEDGFPPDGNLKVAFGSGWYQTATQLPDKAGSGTIQFSDGSKLDVPLESAADTYQAIDKGDANCPGCVSLVVTGATLGSAQVRTSRGLADVPVWLFAIEGMDRPVGHVAVAPEVIKPLPTPTIPEWRRNAPLVSAEELLTVHGTMIEFNLGVGACDKAIVGLVWESEQFIVIGGSVQPPGPAEACTSNLVMHPEQVTLTKPVGARVILDAITGRPVLLR